MSSAEQRPLCERYIHAPGIISLNEGGGTKFVRYFPAISTQNISPFVNHRDFPYKKNPQLFDTSLRIEETTSCAFDLELPVVLSTSQLTQWKDKDGNTHHYHLELYPDLNSKKLKETYGNEWKEIFTMLGGVVEQLRPHCTMEPFRARLLVDLTQQTQQGNAVATVDLIQIGQYGEITINPSFVDKVNTGGKWYKGTLRYRTNLQQQPNYIELVLAEVRDKNKRLIILGFTFDPQSFAQSLALRQTPIFKESTLDESFYRGIINPYLRISAPSS